jgi:hypothetical protein
MDASNIIQLPDTTSNFYFLDITNFPNGTNIYGMHGGTHGRRVTLFYNINTGSGNNPTLTFYNQYYNNGTNFYNSKNANTPLHWQGAISFVFIGNGYLNGGGPVGDWALISVT